MSERAHHLHTTILEVENIDSNLVFLFRKHRFPYIQAQAFAGAGDWSEGTVPILIFNGDLPTYVHGEWRIGMYGTHGRMAVVWRSIREAPLGTSLHAKWFAHRDILIIVGHGTPLLEKDLAWAVRPGEFKP